MAAAGEELKMESASVYNMATCMFSLPAPSYTPVHEDSAALKSTRTVFLSPSPAAPSVRCGAVRAVGGAQHLAA